MTGSLVCAIAIAPLFAPFSILAQVTGGSNYFYYHAVDSNPVTNTCLGTAGSQGFGIITDYYLTDTICGNNASVRSIIERQLSAMVMNGQKNLSLPIFFAESGQFAANPNNQCPTVGGTPGYGGTMLPLPDGTIPPNCLTALRSIIAAAYSAGFERVRVRFVALGPNDPYTWTQFNSSVAARNWRFIQTVRAGLSGVRLGKYDLGNEMIAVAKYPIVLQYAAYIWGQYTDAYGTSDTVGFSVSCGDACSANISSFATVYSGTLPAAFDFHIYGNACPGLMNSGNQMLPVDQVYSIIFSALQSHGWTSQSWIIGEACYNDPIVAQRFLKAHQQAGNLLDSIEQWPPINLSRVPLEYGNYLNKSAQRDPNETGRTVHGK